MSKNFKEYLAEGMKKWDFRIKVAGKFTTEQADTMKALLGKFQVSHFKKLGITPIQELPLDFPKIKNAEVNIYEATLDYPTTQGELQEYLTSSMGITADTMVVRRPGEDLEVYQEPKKAHQGALLNDSEYTESPNVEFTDYYGDKYNTGFVKELNDLLKLQRKARGTEYPTADKVKYNVDLPQNNMSPLSKSKAPEVRK